MLLLHNFTFKEEIKYLWRSNNTRGQIMPMSFLRVALQRQLLRKVEEGAFRHITA
jgi:hypothetical protein